MILQLPNLNANCGAVLGGINTLSIIPVGSVIAIPDPVYQVIEDPMELANGTSLTNLFFPEGAGEFTEAQGESEHGEFYKQKLTVFVPKDTPSKSDLFSKLGQIGHCIAVYVDNNGLQKVVGSVEYPLKFSSELETGKAAGNKNGHTLTFSGESTHKAFFYLAKESGNSGGSGAPVTIKRGDGSVVTLVQSGQTFVISSPFDWGFEII